MFQSVPDLRLKLSNQALELQGLDSFHYLKANSMFHSLHRLAKLKQLWYSLRQQNGKLLDLSSVNKSCRIASQYDLGPRSVPLARIVGSASRSQDYDSEFRPLRRNLQQRWVKIAALRLMNISLPIVELIQIGDAYFVVDGHHRISVARALGQEFIDAQVVVWHLEVKPSPEMVNVPRITPLCFPSGLSLAKGG